jgi:hypothetical protein
MIARRATIKAAIERFKVPANLLDRLIGQRRRSGASLTNYKPWCGILVGCSIVSRSSW